ncbi:hypothetical protein [Streptomyces sp900116325]|uniref:hypothetical protein n=1 Tax=Streptomyces sp. 900116325 TaxID=3154295 RepID=UPI0033F85D9C
MDEDDAGAGEVEVAITAGRGLRAVELGFVGQAGAFQEPHQVGSQAHGVDDDTDTVPRVPGGQTGDVVGQVLGIGIVTDHGQHPAAEGDFGSSAAYAEVFGEGGDLAAVAVVSRDLNASRGAAESVGDLVEGGVRLREALTLVGEDRDGDGGDTDQTVAASCPLEARGTTPQHAS